ncbi:MAG TPA: hypothetical protein VN607_08580 [Gemmatimonadaceae bacterium]|nr:hypothetical protein [Gemmatimonadaceae bacterium]
MPISLRNRRVALYAYSNTGSGGLVAHTFTKTRSAAADGNWWASRSVPTGRESLKAMQAEHTADAMFGFGPEAPVDSDGALIDIISGQEFRITAILPRDNVDAEQQVLAVFNTDAVFTDVGV